ncbi:helix-turn-helix transcriptional regulator [Parasphingorhabdus cellanae]|uniref:Helix-turn-helix transcriptional regulator n=1 Tax=Parasphingorhabdus cellanae TaxID=2806553 RepID=A0ABX7T7K8_9SPHN|nr:helix-turn-helix transcriptional regulator [Parasphingorhabdus cellanae]QTD57595.1 helix-turn-helix transcriptional regulator [Parasphingorhabdus cellanae]
MGQTNLDDISVSSQFLFKVFRSCQDLGARKPVLLAALNVTDFKLRDPQARFDSDAITALYQATVHELERDNIFPDIGHEMIPTGFSDIGYTAMFGETVQDVMQAAAAAVDFGTNRPLLRWEQTASTCRMVCDPTSSAGKDLIFLIFSILSYIGAQITGGGLPPIKAAYFKHREPKTCDDFGRTENHPLHVPCFFNQSQTYLEFYPHVMLLSNPLRNRMVVEAAREHFDESQPDEKQVMLLADLSYNYLFYLLDKSGLSLDAAAETFGMAERTLRRKLVAEGASFRQILERVRRDACQLYFLEGTRSLSEIATKLGYSELSAFTRAYTAWHGRSPSRDLAAHIALAA